MENRSSHITSYSLYGVILTILLVLTMISVLVTKWHLGPLSVGIALLIAGIKGRTVLLYFMHLKYENLLLKIMVSGVFVLYGLVIIITFIDYLFR